MITELGTLTIGAAVPSELAATAAIDISCEIAAPNVSAQLAALLNFSPSVSLSFAAQLDILVAIQANIQAAIAAGIQPPTLQAQIDLAVQITATLQAQLATIQAQVELSASLKGLLANAGVRLIKYSGQQRNFGSELGAALGTSTTPCNALVLLTTNNATWVAMQGVFKTS